MPYTLPLQGVEDMLVHRNLRWEQCKYINSNAKVSSVSYMKSLRVKAPGYNKLFTLKHQEIVPSQANDSKNIFHPLRGKASALNYFVSAKLVKCCTDGVRGKKNSLNCEWLFTLYSLLSLSKFIFTKSIVFVQLLSGIAVSSLNALTWTQNHIFLFYDHEH